MGILVYTSFIGLILLAGVIAPVWFTIEVYKQPTNVKETDLKSLEWETCDEEN